MAFEPDNITKEHVLQAVKYIEESETELRPSTKYDVIINGKAYPPKDVMRYAHEIANGEYIWVKSGGEPTNKYFRVFGFEIVEKQNDPINELIRAYKTKIRTHGNTDELYKWQLGKKFIDVWKSGEAFREKVYKFQFANLLYYNAIVVLKQMADQYPDSIEPLFIELFDDEVSLQNRIDRFRNEFKTLYAKMYDNPLSTHQDERTLSTYLTFYNPKEYTFYKDSFYRKFCSLLGVKIEKQGKKYVHYLDLVKSFKKEYIDTDDELLDLKRGFLDETCDPDSNNLILAQDILYQTIENGINSPDDIDELDEVIVSQEIIDTLSAFKNNDAVLYFFGLIRQLIEELDFTPSDTKLLLSVDSTQKAPLNISAFIGSQKGRALQLFVKDEQCCIRWMLNKKDVPDDKVFFEENEFVARPELVNISMPFEASEKYKLEDKWLTACNKYLN